MGRWGDYRRGRLKKAKKGARKPLGEVVPLALPVGTIPKRRRRKESEEIESKGD